MTRRRPRPRVAIVIPAGGSGTRMGGRVPKQFMRLGGEPILAATVGRFTAHPAVVLVVVAAPRAHLARARRVVAHLSGRVTIDLVEGGSERQESVWRGLQAVPEDMEIILVHDAVRPFITRPLIDAVLHATAETGAAVCARPVAETVKRVEDGLVRQTVDRQGLWTVQTPQGFRADLLREAHDKARREGMVGTDDAMLVERLGHPVRVVPGLAQNMKITTPEDLRRARQASRATIEKPIEKRIEKRTEPRAPGTGHPRSKPTSQPPLQ
jgi:2-C-methyl-D-erythritol 4-phosphate cytidylyltransferase